MLPVLEELRIWWGGTEESVQFMCRGSEWWTGCVHQVRAKSGTHEGKRGQVQIESWVGEHMNCSHSTGDKVNSIDDAKDADYLVIRMNGQMPTWSYYRIQVFQTDQPLMHGPLLLAPVWLLKHLIVPQAQLVLGSRQEDTEGTLCLPLLLPSTCRSSCFHFSPYLSKFTNLINPLAPQTK
jgi:hypothetical protein